MKKFGFTLSELVVAVSIIGVASALIVPIVGRIMPDTKKVTVLKYHNLINQAIEDFYSSANYRPDAFNNNCVGIGCFFITPGINNFQTYLRNALNPGNNVSTVDGNVITIQRINNRFVVTIDTDASNNGQTFFTNQNRNPDSFRFIINEVGHITPGDALTDAYLSNQYSSNNREQDLAIAETNYNSKNYN